ncbi:MAG: PD-(D/E)XK nuclease family protein [Myxococcota bacterium]
MRKQAPVWVVAPTRRAADAFVRNEAQRGPLVGVERRSLTQFAHDMASVGPSVRLSALARRAVMVRAIHDTKLEYFTEIAGLPGFASACLKTLDDLRRFPTLELPRDPRGQDLARLKAAYDKVRAAHHVFDDIDALASAEAPEDDHAILFLGLHPKDPLTVAFVQRMMADRSWGLMTMGPVHSVFSEGASSEPAWERLAPEEPVEVSFQSSPDGFAEATEIARWIQGQTCSYDRIAVAVRHPKHQQSELQAALERAEIPAFYSRGVTRPHPAGRAILALLRCAEEDLSATRFAEFLSFGQVPPLAVDGEVRPRSLPWCAPADDGQLVFSTPPSNPSDPSGPAPFGSLSGLHRWERWLTDAAVVGGTDRWRRRLNGLAEEFELQARWADEADAEAHRTNAQSVRRLQRFALPVIEALQAMREEGIWGVQLTRLRNVCGLALAQPEPVLAVLAELEPMHELGPVGLPELRLTLMEHLGELRQEPDREAYGRVFVGTPEDFVGRQFDAVCVSGVVEGAFPVRLRDDPLLPDDVRSTMAPSFAEVPRRIREEREAFAACTHAASESVLISYPRVRQLEHGSQVPSQFVLEVWSERVGETPSVRQLQSAGHRLRSFGSSWWIPSDPSVSIDESEYDLAAAGNLVGVPEEAGVARYLIEASGGCAARTLRARYARWRSGFGAADGLVAPGPETKALLARESPSSRPHSATGLQTFSECPYKFWLHSILRFRPRPEPLHPEHLDPLTRGALYHDMQFQLHMRLAAGESDVEQTLGAVAKELGEQYAEALCPAIPSVYWRAVAEVERDILGWIRHKTLMGDEVRALHAELAFGLGHERQARDPHSRPEPLTLFGRFQIRGSIDRVEGSRGGLRVVDFKTGRVRPDFDAVGGGRVLQPLLYALAAEALIGEPVTSGALEFATLKGGYVRLETPAQEKAHQERLRTVLGRIDESTRRGDLPAYPSRDACKLCDFSGLCGLREERRAQVKAATADQVRDVLHIRGLP